VIKRGVVVLVLVLLLVVSCSREGPFFGKAINVPAGVGVTDPNRIILVSNINRPAVVGESFIDPNFGTSVRRITNAPAQTFERHEYSQLQAFNSDGTLVLLNQNGCFVVRNMVSLDLVRNLPCNINSPRWNPASPSEVVYYDSNDVGSGNVRVVLQKMNVITGAQTDIYTFDSQYRTVDGSRSWEELSRDGRWIVAILRRTDGQQDIVAYDIANNVVGTRLSTDSNFGRNSGSCPQAAAGAYQINWVAPSPLGNYLVIQWDRDGSGFCEGVEVFNIQTGQYMGHVADNRAHSDMGIDDNGDEIYVSPYSRDNLFLAKTRFPGSANFAQGYTSMILTPRWGHISHLSCKGPAGVCVLTANTNTDAPVPGGESFDNEIYLVGTSGTSADTGSSNDNTNADIRRLAHHRSFEGCTINDVPRCNSEIDPPACLADYNYRGQPQASMSRNGRYVIFGSNFGTCANGFEDYVIDLGTTTGAPPAPICGNGRLEAPEQCDDGNTASGDRCSSTCRTETLAPSSFNDVASIGRVVNHIIGRVLLTGQDLIGADINSDSQINIRDVLLIIDRIITGAPPQQPAGTVCGNNIVEAGEQCDGGNAVSGDGCSSTCQTETPPANRPPQFTALAQQQGQVGSTLRFNILATDPDGDTLTYSLTNPPQGATFTSVTREFSWMPAQATVTPITLTFTASDPLGATAQLQVQVVISAASGGGSNTQMSFFVTSVGNGLNGANFGGRSGADTFCQNLANVAAGGQSPKTWHAYLSLSTADPNVLTDSGHARNWIGTGPWYNANGVLVAESITQLHSQGLAAVASRDELGREIVHASAHDIITGSTPEGMMGRVDLDGDGQANELIPTCTDYTTNDGNTFVMVGHENSDPSGRGDNWNSVHITQCDDDSLRDPNSRTAFQSHLYCFAIN